MMVSDKPTKGNKMTVVERQKIEKKIARKVLECLFAAGFEIVLNNGGDEDEKPEQNADDFLKEMFATDEERIYCYTTGESRKYAGFVWFVYGNDGYDVIADYSLKIEQFLQPAIDLSDSIADQV